MTLDEAIKHAEKVAKRERENAQVYDKVKNNNLYHPDKITCEQAAERCKEYAEEQRQLAEWLKELKDYRERIPSYQAGYNDAKREIALSGEYERAYERGKADAQTAPQWIPVSERLPKALRYVNCTCHSLIDNREDWVIETCYVPQPKGSRYSDWGNIMMLNDGDCEVIAWMYRDIPEPYKASTTGG